MTRDPALSVRWIVFRRTWLVLGVVALCVASSWPALAASARFRRGDANVDGVVDLSDALAIVNSLFRGGGELPCQDAGDINDGGEVDVSDAIFVILHLFRSGDAPPAPGPDTCGRDPTPDDLDCASYRPPGDGCGVLGFQELFGVPNYLPTDQFDPTTREFNVGDVDGDGDIDVAMAVIDRHTLRPSLRMLENLGGREFAWKPLELSQPIDFSVRMNGSNVKLSDLDLDGDLDVVGLSSSPYEAWSYLNDGAGNFTSAGDPLPLGSRALSVDVVVEDLSGDGIPDLVVAVCRDPSISTVHVVVSIGRGDGTFGGRLLLDGFGCPSRVTVADVNRDGLADLFVGDRLSDDQGREATWLSVNNGNGVFASPVKVVQGGPRHGAATSVADIDGDGHVDLVYGTLVYTTPTPTPGPVLVAFGTGSGTFLEARQFAIDGFLAFDRPIAVADLNSDGVQDLLAAGVWRDRDGVVSILNRPERNDGAVVGVSSGGTCYRETIVDLDADGMLDLLCSGSSGLEIRYGMGAPGVFDPGVTMSIPSPGGDRMTVADFDHDGLDDVAVLTRSASPRRGSVTLMHNTGEGVLVMAGLITVGLEPSAIATADFDRDGIEDVVVANRQSVSVAFGYGDGTFFDPIETGHALPQVEAAAVGMLDADPFPDVALSHHGSVSVLFGTAGGTFDTLITLPMDGLSGTESVVVADLSGDGVNELLVGDRVVLNEQGRFVDRGRFRSGTPPQALCVDDFDADGVLDVVIVDGGVVGMYLGERGATFVEKWNQRPVYRARSVRSSDVDQDGAVDLLMNHDEGSFVSVYRGNGDGTFGEPENYAANARRMWVFRLARMNEDEFGDIVVLDSTGLGVLPGRVQE